jgi:hypothetical protein
MTKKILMFLVIAVGAFSIMAVSIWGTLPESQSSPPVDVLEITDFDDTNDYGDKFLFVKGIITEEDYMFEIHFTVSPGNSEQDGILARVDVEDGVQTILSLSEHFVTVIFEADQIGNAVTVTIWDSKTMEEDSVSLLFATESEVDIDDPNVFD